MHRDDEVIRCDELHLAAEAGDVERVRELIAQGHDVNAFDEIGHTPLHYAASGEYLGVAALLLQSGADVNAHDESLIGNTPLGEIAGNCSLKMAKLLVNAGADPIIPGWMQLTALDRAEKRKRGDGPLVYQLLLQAPKPRRRG